MENELPTPPQPAPAPSDRGKQTALGALLLLYFAALGLGLRQVITAPERPSEGGGSVWTMKKAKRPAIAVVSIAGPITVGDQKQFLMPSSADRIARRLRALSLDPDVKAVVLRINSPGGSVGAVQEIYDEVRNLRQAGKKVVASMGDVAASGGYYIAAGADQIVADSGTLTGSIGVIFQLGNVQELFKKIGVRVEAITSGRHKDMGAPFRALTPEEKTILQDLINDAYNQFVDAIADGRKMKRETVLALADGRIYTGAQAKANGLIDHLGNAEAAVAKAAALAEIKEPRILREEDPWNRLFSIFAETRAAEPWSEAAAQFGVRFAYMWELGLR